MESLTAYSTLLAVIKITKIRITKCYEETHYTDMEYSSYYKLLYFTFSFLLLKCTKVIF